MIEEKRIPMDFLQDYEINVIRCTVCERQKSPIGRDIPSAMYGSMCDEDCEGYRQSPWPGTLWAHEKCKLCGGTGYSVNCTVTDGERGDLWACCECSGTRGRDDDR